MILASDPSVSLILSLLAAIVYAILAVPIPSLRARSIGLAVACAWLLHGAALGATLLGARPYFGFAPAISITAWFMVAVYAVESFIYPQIPTRRVLYLVGAMAVLVAAVFPGNPMSGSASTWLALHLALGVACYGLFGVAVIHAWLMSRAEVRFRHAKDPGSGLPLLTLERLTYRFVMAGFVLLSATLLAGYFFGDALYGHGHAWRWDHKAVFSVLAWVTFGILLLGRATLGWRGRRAVIVLYTGSALLVLAYVGSRFVLEVVLGRTP